MNKVDFAIVVHFHQPVGNFKEIFERVYQRCYRPFLEYLPYYPDIKLAVHISGSLLDYFREVHPEILDSLRELISKGQVEIIQQKFEEYRHHIIAVESNAYQMAMAQYLIMETFLPIRAFHTTTDKVARAQRLSRHFENGKVYMKESMTDLLDELLQFPAGAHDDQVDALGFAVDQAVFANTWSKVGSRR